jgi:GntR family transcriptional regulator of vanillate catabolism
MTNAAEREGERALSQTERALLALRDLILSGALKAGERISELGTVERLGVSRTPVRMALVRLEEEGLLESIPSGGFAVKHFTEADIFDAIEVRGALEGVAARLAAERGAPPLAMRKIRDCVEAIDALIRDRELTPEDFAGYVTLNARFHTLLLELCGSRVLARQVERAAALPFASPNGFVMVQSELPEAKTILIIGQEHHRAAVDAIQNREGMRAEAIMREHARLAHRNLQLALRSQRSFDLVPGAPLIRRRAH